MQPAMRIAYILTSLGVGGAERQVLDIAQRMALRGHAVSILVLRARQSAQWPTDLEVHHLDMRRTPGSVVAGLARAYKILRAFRPDIIHSHTFHSNFVARVLRLFQAAPVLSTVHNVYEGGWPRMLAYRITDPLCRRTTAVSQAAANRYVRLKAVSARKCQVVTNGIDTAAFAHDPERRARMREEMGAGEEFIWVATGRIAPAKDYPNLLRAFALVTAECSETRLWVAGEGDADCLSGLKGLADELGLQGRVRWLGLCREMPALLDAGDGFVLSSAWEGMPLALGEAMAMEKPAVATDVGGVRELLGEAGSIVPAKAPEALGKAMLEMMQATPEARAALGRAARVRIESRFSIDAKTDEWEALYREVLARGR
jgi:glycosyltransferase involved in cell wall biosynthesis